MDTQVIIIGAGPVGLTLAIDLGQRGIRCMVVEQRPAPQFLPKMERCNARTMEIFRRMGLAKKIRAAGLPEQVPMDVFIIRSMTSEPVLHLPYPSVAEARAETMRRNDGTLPLEPYQLISQYSLEPLLMAEAQSLQSVTLLLSTEFLSLEQLEAGVSATVRSADGTAVAISGEYLVGCDGGGSQVRKELGIRLEGEGDITRLRQGLFYCEDLYERLPLGNGPGKGRHYLIAGGPPTFMIMQSSTRHWTVHSAVESDYAMRSMFEKIVGVPIEYEMLYCAEWRQNLLLAERYGRRRVFLAGDAVHLVIPTGGLGMNTGVGDAADLAWKLAATLHGWGAPGLLASYEVERRQIGERVIAASRYASLGYRSWLAAVRPEIDLVGEEGDAARAELARVADVEQRKSNEMLGAELGYRYVDSPIVMNLPGGPENDFRVYRPTAWPGARLPHFWLGDGNPIQDRISSSAYTLLVLDAKLETSRFTEAFAAIGVPFERLDVESTEARALYEEPLVLVRPDMHVAWRGNNAEEAEAIAARVSGRASESEAA